MTNVIKFTPRNYLSPAECEVIVDDIRDEIETKVICLAMRGCEMIDRLNRDLAAHGLQPFNPDF